MLCLVGGSVARINYLFLSCFVAAVTVMLNTADREIDVVAEIGQLVDPAQLIQLPTEAVTFAEQTLPVLKKVVGVAQGEHDPVLLMKMVLDKAPLPDQVKTFLQDLPIHITAPDSISKSFKQGVMTTVDTQISGVALKAYFMQVRTHDNQQGTVFMMTLPQQWKLSDMIPGFTHLDMFRCTHPTFIISTIAYTDDVRSVAIEPGLNVLASVDVDALRLPGALGTVFERLKSTLSTMQVHGVIGKDLASSYFGVRVAEQLTIDQRFSLRDFIAVTRLPLPKSTLEAFDKVVLTDPIITAYVNQEGYDITVRSKVALYGIEHDARLMLYYDRARNKQVHSLAVQLPPEFQIKQYFPDLGEHFPLKLHNSRFILADHAYKDQEYDLVVEQGLNIVADIDFSPVRLPSVFARVEKWVSGAFTTLHVHGVIKPDIAQSTLSAYIPQAHIQHTAARLTEFLPLLRLPMPDSIKTKLAPLRFEISRIALSLDAQQQEVSLYSLVHVYDRVLPIKLTLLADEEGELQARFLMQLSQQWRLTDYFPEFQGKFPENPKNPRLIISTMDYLDEDFNVQVKRGFNFIGSLALDQLPDNAVTRSLKKINPVFTSCFVHVVIPERVPDSTIKLALTRLENTAFTLSDVLPTDAFTMPPSMRTFFNNLHFVSPKISLVIDPDIRTIITITELEVQAHTGYKGSMVHTRLLVRKPESLHTSSLVPDVSFELELPHDWHFKDDFDHADYLDTFSIENPRLVLSNFEYDHPTFEQVKVHKGLNFIAGVTLDGPLHSIKSFVENVLAKVGTLDVNDAFAFTGTLGSSLIDSAFSVYIPVRFSIDFDEMKKKGLLPVTMPFIKKIGTDTFSATIAGRQKTLAPGSFDISLETGLRVFLRTQEKPLILRAGTSVGATESSLYGYMDTPFDPAFGVSWLALDEFGIEITFDYNILQAALAATGIPAPSGIGLRGVMQLGEEGERTKIDVASKIAVSSVSTPDIILFGKTEKLTLAQLMWLLAKIGKQDIKLNNIPNLELEKVDFRLLPNDTTLAQKKYGAGFYATAWINLLGMYGGLDFSVSKFGISGKGTLPKIDTPWFTLSAVEKKPKEQGLLDTLIASQKAQAAPPVGLKDFPFTATALKESIKTMPQGGPTIQLDLSWFKQRAVVNGRAELPWLKIAKEIEADISLAGITFKTEEEWLGLFKTTFEVSVTADDMYVRGAMEQQGLNVFGKLLLEVAREVVKAAQRDVRVAQQEAIRARNDLDVLKKRVDQAKDKCIAVKKGVQR